MQTTMQYKTFIWPHNPRIFKSRLQRQTAVLKHPGGDYTLQDLGNAGRVFEGEGEFYGPEAYNTFRRLAAVFCESGAGVLYHPSWRSCTAWFTSLQLLQEPREDYVSYGFVFQAEPMSDAEKIVTLLPDAVTLGQDETLTALSDRYHLSMKELMDLNPEIANPAEAAAGTKVVIR